LPNPVAWQPLPGQDRTRAKPAGLGARGGLSRPCPSVIASAARFRHGRAESVTAANITPAVTGAGQHGSLLQELASTNAPRMVVVGSLVCSC